MTDEKLHLIAEAPVTEVDEQRSNSVYMRVKMRMLSTEPNCNGHVVEAGFIEEIVNNQSFYAGTPVKADAARLIRGLKDGLGHRFDPARREYMTEQIGSLLSFESVEENGALVLYGTARIEKSHADLCATIIEMFDAGELFFSFEITAKNVKRDGELIYIGADADNHLTGMCIVSVPAYSEAKAVKLVAEMQNEILIKAQGLIQWAAELEIDDVRCKLYAKLFNDSDALLKGWYWSLHELGVDYAMLKQHETGNRKMVKYHVESDEVVIDDVYDIEWVRKAVTAAVAASKEDDEAVEPEDEEEDPADPVDEDEPEEEKRSAEAAEPPVAVKPAPAEPVLSAEQVSELEALREFKRTTEAAQLAAERSAKQDKLRQLVEQSGMSPDTLQAEIDNLDYEAICASLAATEPAEPDTPAVNPLVSGGIALGGSKWDGYISDPTGLKN